MCVSFVHFTFSMVAFLKNGLINMMHAFNIGPIFTTWIVHCFTGRLSSFAAPTLQFFGMSHLRIAELMPVQSAITERPLIWVTGSLSNICMKMSSTIEASTNWVLGPIFPINKSNKSNSINIIEIMHRIELKAIEKKSLPSLPTITIRPFLSRLSSTIREFKLNKSMYSEIFLSACTWGLSR